MNVSDNMQATTGLRDRLLNALDLADDVVYRRVAGNPTTRMYALPAGICQLLVLPIETSYRPAVGRILGIRH